MSNERKVPHKSMDSEFAKVLLTMNAETIEQYSKYVVTPGHDDTVANHFRTLSTKLIEQAILRYYYTDSTASDVLDLFSQAALAASNYFRLRTSVNEDKIQFEWRGSVCSVQSSPFRIMATDSSVLQTGLMAARLSGNTRELEFLSYIKHSAHILDATPDFTALRVMYLQALCLKAESHIIELREKLVLHIHPAQRLNAKIIQSNCKVFLSLPESNSIQLTGLIEDSLSVHRKLYNTDRGNMRVSIFGLISMEMLTAVVLANLYGVRVDIKNDYLPFDLIKVALGRHNSTL